MKHLKLEERAFEHVEIEGRTSIEYLKIEDSRIMSPAKDQGSSQLKALSTRASCIVPQIMGLDQRIEAVFGPRQG